MFEIKYFMECSHIAKKSIIKSYYCYLVEFLFNWKALRPVINTTKPGRGVNGKKRKIM